MARIGRRRPFKPLLRPVTRFLPSGVVVAGGIAAGQATATGIGVTLGTLTGARSGNIKHALTVQSTQDGNPEAVQTADWNDGHVMDVVDIDPLGPATGAAWMLGTGDSPARRLEFKFCDTDGVIVTLFSVKR